jgi:hypothetical protein
MLLKEATSKGENNAVKSGHIIIPATPKAAHSYQLPIIRTFQVFINSINSNGIGV